MCARLFRSDRGAVSVETIIIVIGLVAIAGIILFGIERFANARVDELNSLGYVAEQLDI